MHIVLFGLIFYLCEDKCKHGRSIFVVTDSAMKSSIWVRSRLTTCFFLLDTLYSEVDTTKAYFHESYVSLHAHEHTQLPSVGYT